MFAQYSPVTVLLFDKSQHNYTFGAPDTVVITRPVEDFLNFLVLGEPGLRLVVQNDSECLPWIPVPNDEHQREQAPRAQLFKASLA